MLAARSEKGCERPALRLDKLIQMSPIPGEPLGPYSNWPTARWSLKLNKSAAGTAKSG